MADEIKSRSARVVLIAGPSSSGKTTSSKRLSVHLLACGLKPFAISLDDFFVDRVLTPRKPDGDYDFESIHSIDLPISTSRSQGYLQVRRSICHTTISSPASASTMERR